MLVMAITNIEINTSLLNRTISEMNSDISNIKSLAEEIYKDVAVLDTMWDGQANAAFKKQFDNDNQDLQALCECICKYIQDMVAAGNSYDKCESTVSDIVNSIRI